MVHFFRRALLITVTVQECLAKIQPLKSGRRKGIPHKSAPAGPSTVNEKDDISSSDSAKGNGDCQLASPGSLKFLLQVLDTMSSPPTIPLYSGRYPNGYGPPFNGIEPHEPLDFRKVESQRRYVWAFHRAKNVKQPPVV
ncbi:hypothetical protein quinque_015087 [Culex quinquefasciatus]